MSAATTFATAMITSDATDAKQKPQQDQAKDKDKHQDKDKKPNVKSKKAGAQNTSVYRMVMIVNRSLNMNKGKMCAQVGHAVAHWTRVLEASPTPEYKQWKTQYEPMIVLKASEDELVKLHQLYPQITHMVVDAGFTQVPANSKTVLAFAPCETKQLPAALQSLPLL